MALVRAGCKSTSATSSTSRPRLFPGFAHCQPATDFLASQLSFLFSAPRLPRTLFFVSCSDRVAKMLSRRPGGPRVVSDAAADPVRTLSLLSLQGEEWAACTRVPYIGSLISTLTPAVGGSAGGASGYAPRRVLDRSAFALREARITRGLRNHRPLQRGFPHGALPVHAAARAPPRPRPCRCIVAPPPTLPECRAAAPLHKVALIFAN